MNDPIRMKRRISGFSTPEMLMTIVVFSFGLLPLIMLFQKSHKVTAQAKNLMVAQTLGRSKIDEIRAYGFEGVKKNLSRLAHSWKQVEGDLVIPESTDPKGVKFPPYYKRFETMVSITPYPVENPEKFTVGLNVRWIEAGREGGTFSLQFGTVIVKLGAKYGP